jgi:hypothetical protein
MHDRERDGESAWPRRVRADNDIDPRQQWLCLAMTIIVGAVALAIDARSGRHLMEFPRRLGEAASWGPGPMIGPPLGDRLGPG